MKLKNAAAAALAAAAIATAGTAHAETAGPQEAAYTPTADGAGLEVSFVDGTHFAQSHGAVEVVDAAGNVVEVLPATARDKDGSDVRFVYTQRSDSQLRVDVVSANGVTTYGWWGDWGKCAAGIAGGAGTEALGSAAVGSAVPGIGTATGAVVGGVAGALTGAATAC